MKSFKSLGIAFAAALILQLSSLSKAEFFSTANAKRLHVESFSEESKEGHVMPPPSFFVQQLKNMCRSFEHEGYGYYLCSHLVEGQNYVVPIFEFHKDEGMDGHIFMLELMPQKAYYHKENPVAFTSRSETQHQELRVLVPKQHVPTNRLLSLAEELARPER